MESIVLILLALATGWLLGLVGFFKALRALREVAALRAQLERTAPAASAPLASPPPASPWAPSQPVVATPPVAPPETPTAEAPSETLPQAPTDAPARPPRDLEALLTQRWGIWLGAVALLLAGVFLVRYAVDQGLLGPAVRCLLAGLLGVALVMAAEVARRRAGPDRSAPAPPALAAGGVAVLFGAAYGAGPLYGLLGPIGGFVALALVAFAALALSLRYGMLVAAIGIAAAYLTPALVAGAAPYAPGLFGYLLLVTAAALAVVRHTAWAWLGWAATVAGAIWVALAATGGLGPQVWAPGLFVPAAAALNLLLLPGAALDHPVGRRLAWLPFAALAAAGLLLAAAVQDPFVRAGLLLLSPLSVWRGVTEPRLDRLPWLAALVFLLVLLVWALPAWRPTGEVLATEGFVMAVLPGAWAPAVIRPLLWTAALLAGFYAAAGLLLERRQARPLPWAALAAAVPVLTLAVIYAQVGLFQPVLSWAIAALALAAALVTASWAAGDDRQRAGVHAAGAVAALALACAMLLSDQWLTLALALLLPPLAWIEASTDLPALRRVALVVAAVVLVRLLGNVWLLDYDFGPLPVANTLLPSYGVPAAALALAAWRFRKRGDDRVVAVLEAGAVALVTALVALEIRHGATGGDLTAAGSFTELALDTAALAVQATVLRHLAMRTGRVVQGWAWRLQGGAALAAALWLLLDNPLIDNEPAGQAALLCGYLVPALLAAWATTRPLPNDRRWRPVLGGYAVLAGWLWLSLEIRLAYHPGLPALDMAPVVQGELWAWSGGWLLYGGALMALGIRLGQRAVRLAALAIIGLVTAKAFLIDMAGLEGLWRVLSFLGLGLGLIALGAAWRRFVAPALPDEQQRPQGTA